MDNRQEENGQEDNRQELSRLQSLIRIYEFVLDQLDEGVHVIDESGRTIIYNRKMAEIEAMSKTDVLNKDVLDVFVFPDDEQSTLLQALMNGRAAYNVKQRYFNVKGKEITTMNHSVPIVLNDDTLGAVEIARDITKIEKIQENMLKRPETTRFTLETVIGDSDSIRAVIEDARRATGTTSSVLIVGETGTGKDLIAHSIHNGSTRSHAPFISQNCAALPESLIEEVLFGTAKGASKGAVDGPGLIEQADGGTLLLDELNSLVPAVQAKLLRSIQERTVRRIGDTEDRTVDVRFLATINEDPVDAISADRLSKDLYYCLSAVTLFLPPLRNRRDDIPYLTRVLIEKFNRMFDLNVSGVSDDVMEFFMTYDWPGNVRELEHTIEAAINVVGDEPLIQIVHLPFQVRRKFFARDEQPSGQTGHHSVPGIAIAPRRLNRQIREYERVFIQKVLAKHGGNISAAARELGMSRQSLQYRLRKLELQSKS